MSLTMLTTFFFTFVVVLGGVAFVFSHKSDAILSERDGKSKKSRHTHREKVSGREEESKQTISTYHQVVA